MLELRLRSRIGDEELQSKVGKVLGPADVNLIAVGDCRVYKPNGDLLFVYRRAAIPVRLCQLAYPILHSIRGKTTNRGMASGSKRIVRPWTGQKNSYSALVMSNIIGAMDRMGGRFPYCRLTAWTGQNFEQFAALRPYIKAIASIFEAEVTDRYMTQWTCALGTNPDWVIPGTPFTTITVNNSYATGVHKDAGDLVAGFSCLQVLRRGEYRGGILTFPEYRVGVDLQDGDLLLMDAHEWHGNTDIEPLSPDAERISCVLYFREALRKCGSAAEELQRARSVGLGAQMGDES